MTPVQCMRDFQILQFYLSVSYTSQGWWTTHNFRKIEGPVLNCRVSRKHRSCYLNESVIDEMRNKFVLMSDHCSSRFWLGNSYGF